MRTHAKIFLLALLVLIISCNKKETTLEQYINTEIAGGEVPGFGISIIVAIAIESFFLLRHEAFSLMV